MNPPQPPRPNKRRGRRCPPKQSTKVICYGNQIGMGPNIAQQILDLSETGVRLILKAELKVGQRVCVDLEGMAHRAVKAEAQVVWIVPTADGRFCAGVKFEKNLPWAEVFNLARP